MKTVEKRIRECVAKGNKAFIPYMMAGDGGLDSLKDKLLFLEECGATAIEIGIPFSDPVADGEVIQRAGERALADGVTLRKVLDELVRFKGEVSVPLIIMTYLNPILAYGINSFIERCEKIGIGGLIIPDLPLEEDGLLRNGLEGTDIALIPLVSLTSSLERIVNIAKQAEGFIYAVTVNGITGVRNEFEDKLSAHLKRVKEESSVPVLAGFGISTSQQVEQLGAQADGVIVGSAIVDALHRDDLEVIRGLMRTCTMEINNSATS
ncbi:tryptophan synthase subunit alpha [Sporosarcina highlanderae]|uniref:Tryptophan synthase alpha chain n=1 Tax=Sporosarcina highlanderae TaxID=3035916 RepID=A0ABT8JQI7_9BACL|nr:tryptophan synthase subunit alpha [Sporosarcina highlanderae]MDN4606677.1 tryptophan synthase subunit alpha [Sporosarcina highlanderae]